MKSLKDFDVKDKRVLLRCDFQVPLSKEGEILDDFRIRQTIPTIKYLAEKGAKIILMSHYKPEGKDEALSLKPISLRLEGLLGRKVNFLNDCLGEEVKNEIGKMKRGEVYLLENLRFHQGEEKNDENFAKELASLGDIYINDAFGVSHRNHASLVLIPRYLLSGAGFLLEKEIKTLSKIIQDPKRPLVAVIGGAKISTRIKVIEKFLKFSDHLILGGKIANVILAGKGLLIGEMTVEKELADRIEKIELTNPKLHLPLDAIIVFKKGEDYIIREGAIGTVRKEEEVFDIGPETRLTFKNIIKNAKMILWSGPLGVFEDERFERGTREIGEAIAGNRSAFKVIGGGESLEAAKKFGFLDKFEHISTGGGAMLQFLAGEKLPGIEALK